MAEQLIFDLPSKPALEREDFFVSDANAQAVAVLENWHSWPNRKMLLVGAAGSGKTHLAHVWAVEARAKIISATEICTQDIATISAQNLVVENTDEIAGQPEAETALFHLHNLLLANGHSLLLTGSGDIQTWSLGLPDLKSRLLGTAVVHLQEPDDALLMAVILKVFSDRQINVSPSMLPYVLRRIDRNFAAVHQMVDMLDKVALSEGRAVNRGLASDVLDKITSKGP
ncbi:P-loop NTPase family protein [Cochlodiniinecator piscidefendens]|uniref:DnaA ATPase domain-containing protein n=1 Tax=Cochlodiniinecator piscidefendens TaxID=2715756 RepID=UPI001409EE46|nr:DnaA/Hda family protein [Cochlodiniinecator piscidefendens]